MTIAWREGPGSLMTIAWREGPGYSPLSLCPLGRADDGGGVGQYRTRTNT